MMKKFYFVLSMAFMMACLTSCEKEDDELYASPDAPQSRETVPAEPEMPKPLHINAKNL